MPEAAPQNLYKSMPSRTLAVDLAARTVEHYVTVPTADEDDEVLLPRGGDISRFTRGGTVFDVHEYGSKDVVGQCLGMRVSDEGVIAKTRFSPRPPAELWPAANAWEPDRLLWLYHLGDIKGWSVGFKPLEARLPTKADRAKWGERLKRVHTRWRMLEYSVAPLPCNGDVVTLERRGILSKRLAAALVMGKRPDPAAWQPTAPAAALPMVARPAKVYVVVPGAPAPARRAVTDTAAVAKAMAAEVRRAVAKATGRIYAD